MTPDDRYHGTGVEFCRIDLGEIGTVVVEDDGDPDPCASVRLAGDDGQHHPPLFGPVTNARATHGDTRTLEMLQDASMDVTTDGTTSTSPSGPIVPQPFKCDGCGLTWPGKDNQTPDGPEDWCPECDDTGGDA